MANLLVIITGGIAAYKTPELVRRLRETGQDVTCVMTENAQRFVTPLSLSAVSENPVYTSLWDLKDEREMGHIRLTREVDAILIAPASADFLAKMAHGLNDDLASAVMLASDKPAIIAPAMNHRMWLNPATQRNVALLREAGHTFIGPEVGDMACGEFGPGRMTDVPDLVAALSAPKPQTAKPLAGKHALITSGPTREALDPVRYLSNHSSGQQGAAIAASLAEAGARVTLVSGPTDISPIAGIEQIDVLSARDMLAACEAALPADILICAAAVADYRAAHLGDEKMKKTGEDIRLSLVENPDILKTLCHHAKRPGLTIGFAAETGDLAAKAMAKRTRKGCDWLLANDVGANPDIFGGKNNEILFLSGDAPEAWPLQSKTAVADALTAKIITHFS